jgi:hypothetical protein
MAINLGIALGAAADTYRKADKERREREYEDWKRGLEKAAEERKQAIRTTVKEEYGKIQGARDLTPVEAVNLNNLDYAEDDNRAAIQANATAEKVVRTSPYTEEQANQAIAKRVMAIDPDAGFDYRAKSNQARLSGFQIEEVATRLQNNKDFRAANERFLEHTTTIQKLVTNRDAAGLVAAANKAGIANAKVVNGNEIEYYDPITRNREILQIGEAGDKLLNAAYKQLQPTLLKFAPDPQTQMQILKSFNDMNLANKQDIRADAAAAREAELHPGKLTEQQLGNNIKQLDYDIRFATKDDDIKSIKTKRELLQVELDSREEQFRLQKQYGETEAVSKIASLQADTLLKQAEIRFRREADPIKKDILGQELELAKLNKKFLDETNSDRKKLLGAQIREIDSKIRENDASAGWLNRRSSYSGTNDGYKMKDAAGGDLSINQKTGDVYAVEYSKDGTPSLRRIGNLKDQNIDGGSGKDSKSDSGANKGVSLPMKNGKVDAAQLKDGTVYNTDKGPVRWNGKTQKFEQ